MAKQPFPLRMGNILLCEDTRAEVNFKHSLLGVFGGDVLVSEFGGHLKVAVYAELFALAAGVKTMELTLAYNGNDFMKAELQADFIDLLRPAIVASPGALVEIAQPGELTVTVVCDGHGKVVHKKRVSLADVPLTTLPNEPGHPSSQSQTDVPAKVSPRVKPRPSRRPSDGVP